MQADKTELRRRWSLEGFFVVRQFIDSRQIRLLREACDHALQKVRALSSATGHSTTHIRGFLLPEYYADRPLDLRHLVNFISSPHVVELIGGLGQPHEGPLTLRDAQYFHEPTKRSWDGPWHRDHDVPDATAGETLAQTDTLLRFRVAFENDDHLEYVAGSHARPDTEEEARVRKGAVRNGSLTTGASRIVLGAGDVCVFDTRGLHRARYQVGRVRRTLDALFGFSMPRTRVTSEAVAEYLRAMRLK